MSDGCVPPASGELSRGLRVVVLHNLPVDPADTGMPVWRESDAGVLKEVDAVGMALTELGVPWASAGVRRLSDVPAALAAHPNSVVFNLVERLEDGVTRFNWVPAVCEALGRACTGADTDCLSLTLDKDLSKARFRAWGVPTPPALVVAPGQTPDPGAVPSAPLIVKPLCCDGSEGIHGTSLVRDPSAELAAALARVHRECAQPALVEQYIAGREINVSLIERQGRAEALPLSEIDFSLFPAGRPHIVDYEVKWVPGTIPGHVSPRRVPANVDPATADRVRRAALGAWQACGCQDYARIDLRIDAHGQPFVLEANANPDISPLAGLPAALRAAGIPFAAFVKEVLLNAVARRAALRRIA